MLHYFDMRIPQSVLHPKIENNGPALVLCLS